MIKNGLIKNIFSGGNDLLFQKIVTFPLSILYKTYGELQQLCSGASRPSVLLKSVKE